MNELGKILKERRLELKLDYEQVYQITKVHPKFLKAIEDADLSVFDAEVYYKSYVRSYARCLDIDAEELINAYNERKLKKEVENKSQSLYLDTDDLEKDNNENERIDISKKIKFIFEKKKIIICIFVLLILIFLFILLIPNITNIVNKFPTRSVKNENVEQIKEEVVPQEVPQEEVITDLTLELEAVDTVWVKVDGDGKEIFEGTLLPGWKKSLTTKDEFVVKIGYAPGLKMFFNGEEIDTLDGAYQDVNTIKLSR